MDPLNKQLLGMLSAAILLAFGGAVFQNGTPWLGAVCFLSAAVLFLSMAYKLLKHKIGLFD